MMKILILSANTGQGHNSCGRAIQEVWQMQGNSSEIVDVFALVSVKLSDSISKGHEKVIEKHRTYPMQVMVSLKSIRNCSRKSISFTR